MSLTSKARSHQRLVKAKVSTLTGYSAENLFALTVETAYTYLKQVWRTDAYGMEMLPKTPEFWAWWRIEWARIDERFLKDMESRPNRDHMYYQTYYQHYHRAELDNIHMNSTVMEASAHRLIKQLAKSK